MKNSICLRSVGMALAGVLALSTACTVRYSQSLAGGISQAQGTEVQSSDSGFSLFNIAFSEPRSAHEQVTSLMGACRELRKVEVDYREIFFVIIGFPRVRVTGICVP